MNMQDARRYLEDSVFLRVKSFNKDSQTGIAGSSSGKLEVNFHLSGRIPAPWLEHVEVDEPNGTNLVGTFIAGQYSDNGKDQIFTSWFSSSPLRGVICRLFGPFQRKEVADALAMFESANRLNRKVGGKVVTLEEVVAAKLKELDRPYSKVRAFEVLPAVKAEVDAIALAKAIGKNKHVVDGVAPWWIVKILKAPAEVDETRRWKRSGDRHYDCPACEATTKFESEALKRILRDDRPETWVAACSKCGLELFFSFKKKVPQVEVSTAKETQQPLASRPAAKKGQPTAEQQQEWAERFSQFVVSGS